MAQNETTIGGVKLTRPQDPFYPQQKLHGPGFLDSEACLCVLRDSPAKDDDHAVWQCAANQKSVYKTRVGKWFKTTNSGSRADGLAVNDGSNPPDTDKAFGWSSKSQAFVDPNDPSAAFQENDKSCTGKNNTVFSTALYQAFRELQTGKLPVAAAPCFRPGAIPLQITDGKKWRKDGCNEGFYCPNNTVNSLPQYCPPFTECQEARLGGQVCKFEGKNIGMGPFEPVVCQAGFYCPTKSNGRESIRCPAGSYCQPGAATPTPCLIGSRCPEGSVSQVFLIPLAIIVLIDIIIVVSVIFMTLRSRLHARASRHIASIKKHKNGVTATITGYKALPDETDQETVEMDATYVPGRDGYSGFQAVLDMQPTAAGRRITQDLTPQLQKFVDSMRRATDASNFGLSFGYEDLSFHPKKAPRPILQNITGSIERGSLAAVMGGSGAGKSTFVNVLMGKTANTGGIVAVNGIKSKINRYKKLIGYVPQDDVVLPELTVYENIVHSAKVRLPRTWSNADIESHVESVIDCLELSHVRDSLVGSVGKPVISGGQRKRVSIGMELAAAPMAIFLDEPTSGLDATAAASIMRTLQALARLGISVIVIIHQPRVEIFEMLDNLILLGNGQIIFEGPQNNVHRYFESLGFSFPEHSNHGDVVTDIITGNGRIYKRAGDVSKEALIAHWASSRNRNSIISDKSQARQSVMSDRSAATEMLKKRGASRIKQVGLCLSRAMLQQYRTKGNFFAEMALASLAGFLLGLAHTSKEGVLFRGLYNSPFEVLSLATDFASAPQLALLVAISIGLVAGAPGVKSFSEELLLHRREAEAGHSRISYFVAKMVSVFPRMILGCLHFTALLMILTVPIINWGVAFVSNFLYFYCIYGLASCISMVVRREDAPLFATMISLIVGILSGAAPPLSKVKTWHLEWLWRASPGTWLAEIYFGQLVAPYRYLYNVDLASKVTGFHLDFMWRNIMVLLAIGTVYRMLAYIGLVFGHRLRR